MRAKFLTHNGTVDVRFDVGYRFVAFAADLETCGDESQRAVLRVELDAFGADELYLEVAQKDYAKNK